MPYVFAGRLPTVFTNGSTSCVQIEPPPMKACSPTRQNWCTAVNAPIVAKSPISTCPASVALFAKIVFEPTWQSWATCE